MRSQALISLVALWSGCHWIFPYGQARSDGPGLDGDSFWPDQRPSEGLRIDHSGTWKLGPVEPLDSLNTPDEEDENYLSKDGRTIYFSRRLLTGVGKEIYVATRATTLAPFGIPIPLAAVNSTATDCFSTTEDELVGFLMTSRPGGPFPGTIDVWVGTRSSTTPWTIDMFKPDPVLSTADDDWDIFTSLDGLRVWWSPQVHTNPPPQQIVFAERASRNAPFSAPKVVGELTQDVADITLSADERLAVFTAYRGGDEGNLYYATRPDRFAPFSMPQPIPDVNVNSPSRDGEPFLSADGTELYFASDRPGGKGLDDLYRVKILSSP